MRTTEIIQLLDRHEVSIAGWGKGSALGFDDLLGEIARGEMLLEEREGKLVRICEGVEIHCFHRYENGDTVKLIESALADPDLHPHRTALPSIWARRKSEKERETRSLALEHPVITMLDAIESELGFAESMLDTLEFAPPVELVRPMVPSESYPGLFTERHVTMFEVYLDGDHFCEGGYQGALVLDDPDLVSRPRARRRRKYLWVPYQSHRENA